MRERARNLAETRMSRTEITQILQIVLDFDNSSQFFACDCATRDGIRYGLFICSRLSSVSLLGSDAIGRLGWGDAPDLTFQ